MVGQAFVAELDHPVGRADGGAVVRPFQLAASGQMAAVPMVTLTHRSEGRSTRSPAAARAPTLVLVLHGGVTRRSERTVTGVMISAPRQMTPTSTRLPERSWAARVLRWWAAAVEAMAGPAGPKTATARPMSRVAGMKVCQTTR
jgi:hypothetical protein